VGGVELRCEAPTTEVWSERAAEDPEEAALPASVLVVEGIPGDAPQILRAQLDPIRAAIHSSLKLHHQALKPTVALARRVLTIQFSEFRRCQGDFHFLVPFFPSLPAETGSQNAGRSV